MNFDFEGEDMSGVLKKKKSEYRCPCCGYYTYTSEPVGEYEICPVCFWEDDPFQSEDPDLEGMANGVSLNQARKNYKKFGACQKDLLKYVRAPKENELTGIDD